MQFKTETTDVPHQEVVKHPSMVHLGSSQKPKHVEHRASLKRAALSFLTLEEHTTSCFEGHL